MAKLAEPILQTSDDMQTWDTWLVDVTQLGDLHKRYLRTSYSDHTTPNGPLIANNTSVYFGSGDATTTSPNLAEIVAPIIEGLQDAADAFGNLGNVLDGPCLPELPGIYQMMDRWLQGDHQVRLLARGKLRHSDLDKGISKRRTDGLTRRGRKRKR